MQRPCDVSRHAPCGRAPTISVGLEQSRGAKGQKEVEGLSSGGSQSQLHIQIKTTSHLRSFLCCVCEQLPGDSTAQLTWGAPLTGRGRSTPKRGSEVLGPAGPWELMPAQGPLLGLESGSDPRATLRAVCCWVLMPLCLPFLGGNIRMIIHASQGIVQFK